MFMQIDIPKVDANLTNPCNCGNTKWFETTIEISPYIAGNLIIAWEISMGLECSNCKLYVLKDIGVFDDHINLLPDFPNSPDFIKRLKELNLNDKIDSIYQEIADSCKSEGISWIKT